MGGIVSYILGEAAAVMDANTKANAEEIISISELQGLVRTDSLFSSMSDDQIARLRDVISEIRHVAEGGFVVNEGEEAKNIYIIKDGAFEVLKSATIPIRLTL